MAGLPRKASPTSQFLEVRSGLLAQLLNPDPQIFFFKSLTFSGQVATGFPHFRTVLSDELLISVAVSAQFACTNQFFNKILLV